MKRRELILSSSFLTALSAGCLRLTEDQGSSADTERTSTAGDTDSKGTATADDTATGRTSVDDTTETTTSGGSVGLTERWSLERDVRTWNDTARTVTDGNRLYFTAGYEDGSVAAVDVDDGSTVWERPKPARLVFDVVHRDGELYLLGSDGGVTVLDAADGTRNWSVDNPFSSRSDSDDPLWPGGLAVSAERVVASIYDIDSDGDYSYVYAVDRAVRTVDWEIESETIAGYAERDFLAASGISPIVDGTVFVGFSRVLLSIEVRSGTVNWAREVPCEGPVTVTEDSVFVPGGGRLYSIRKSDGETQWRKENNASEGPNFVSELVVADGTVYACGRDTDVYALDQQDGAERWTAETGGLILVGPAVTESIVWAGSRDGRLYAFDRSSGSQLLNELVQAPVVGFEHSDGVLMALTDGDVSAYTIE